MVPKAPSGAPPQGRQWSPRGGARGEHHHPRAHHLGPAHREVPLQRHSPALIGLLPILGTPWRVNQDKTPRIRGNAPPAAVW